MHHRTEALTRLHSTKYSRSNCTSHDNASRGVTVGEDTASSLSNGAREFEGFLGYAFLPRCEEYPSPLKEDECEALKAYWHTQNWPNADTWAHAVCRWAKLQLPNGQKARSVWHETSISGKCRRLSCVEVSPTSTYLGCSVFKTWKQVNYNNNIYIANVLYYFCIRFGDSRYPLAMVNVFSEPDPEVLAESSSTVYLCDLLTGHNSITVVPITAIHSVVAMFPEMRIEQSAGQTRTLLTGKFALMRHAYLEVARFTSDGLLDEEESAT